VKQWKLVTPLHLVRGLLHALVLPATSFGILVCGTAGALFALEVAGWLGSRTGLFAAVLATVGGLAAAAVAYAVGDRLNERVARLRAPIGSASVGADGVRWRRFGKPEFVGWSKVSGIVARGEEVVLSTEGRGEIALRVKDAAAFTAAAREAMERYRAADPPDPIAALELTGEHVADWLGRARKLLEAGAYRDAAVGEEQLVRVATDPRAAAAQRIGSAAALANASEDARARVRVAIEETADPVVANALEDALAGGRAVGRAMQEAVRTGRS
jgi:hypothetical protein